MSNYKAYLKRIIIVLTSIFAGISLFISFLSFSMENSVFNSSFHKELFAKNNIYGKTQQVIDTRMSGFISSLKKTSPENYKQYNQVFLILEKSLTPEMVRFNLDTMRDGLFKYFEGFYQFLPDIYVKNPNKTSGASGSLDFGINQRFISPNQTGNTSNQQTDEGNPATALNKIDKINLSAVLLYINRSDISDFLLIIRLFFFINNWIPAFALLVFLFMAVLGLVLCSKPLQILNWIVLLFLCTGILSAAALLILFSYLKFIMPSHIYSVAMSVPLQIPVIIKYINSCLNPLLISFFIGGLFSISLIFLIRLFYKRFYNFSVVSPDKGEISGPGLLKISFYTAVLLLIVYSIVNRYNNSRLSFNNGDYQIALSKLLNSNTVTKVIPAKNEAIYGLNIILSDNTTNIPVTNVPVRVNGTSSLLKKDYNVTAVTDGTGIAKFTLDKGAFQISFPNNYFPTDYQIPSPFFYNLKAAGTTIITINLSKNTNVLNKESGITEIEILDKDNKPVSGVELFTKSQLFSPGYPDFIYSYTNTNGIAVFKLVSGSHTISFTEASFPKKYIIPSPFNISIESNKLNRYTIKLVPLSI